ncbi:MAG: glycosyltransferase family 4 protein [Anaerolineae bacterium]|nr:glycosyltransferase family 4 protein [Anaerolineae bacterium]
MGDPLRVLFLTTNYARDEGDYHSPWLRQFIRRLAERGISVTVLAPAFRGLGTHRVDGVLVHRFRYAPARWETLTQESGAPNKLRANPLYWLLVPPYMLGGLVSTIRLARARRFDVLHVHWPVPQALFAQAARRVRPARCVLTFYGADVSLARRLPFMGALVRRWVRDADAVTAISTYTARSVRGLTGVQPQVVPFGVELPRREGIPAPLQGTHRVLAVGRLIERKGYPVLIRAIGHLRREVPDVRLVIVGEGQERRNLEALVRELKLEEWVRLAGRVSDEELDALYRWADVFVLPSLVDRSGDTEGLGVVLLEALSYGRPVIASAVGGITDIIQDGETGLLVPPGDPEALAQALARIFHDPKAARSLAERGWAVNRRRFDWERIADTYAALYGA